MSTTITTNNHKKEDTIMETYLVKAPKPKCGQIASTCGIRDKKTGQIVNPYKDPKPYIPPQKTPSSTHQAIPQYKPIQSDSLWKSFGRYLLKQGIEYFATPIVQEGYKYYSTKVINYLFSPTQPKEEVIAKNTSSTIETYKECDSSDNSKVIQFPNRKTG